MKLDGYIKEILFTKDFVIVPDFGGFVCKHFAAEINAATQMFIPPSKKVTFQPAIKDHDLFLISHVSKKMNCSLDESSLMVKQVVAEWKLDLAEGRHILLEDIGRIYKDSQGQWAFQSDINANFNVDSFGLGIFRFPVLKEETSLQKQVSKVLPQAVRKQNGKGGYWKAAALFIGVAGLLYIGTQKSDFKNLDYARFNPLVFSKSVPFEKTVVKPDNSSSETVIMTDAIDVPAEKTSTEVLPVLPKAQPVANKPYHVIVGAFKEKSNARRMVLSLTNKGFEQTISFLDNGYYKVSVDQFSNRSQAVVKLSSYKARVQKSAWIFRN